MPRGSTSPQRGRNQAGRGERRISVRSVRRDKPDVRKLARALIGLAMAQAEADARSEREKAEDGTGPKDGADGR